MVKGRHRAILYKTAMLRRREISRVLSKETESAIGKSGGKVFQVEMSTRTRALRQEQSQHIGRMARQPLRVMWGENGR